MSGGPTGITSPALRRGALAVQAINVAITRFHRPSTRKLLVETRATIADLAAENRSLRRSIVFGTRFEP